MKHRDFDARRLDVEAFAKAGAALSGTWPVIELERLAEAAHPERRPAPGDVVTWRARGELRPVQGAAPEVWLHLEASTAVALECQRCLQPVEETLRAERRFQFVHGEETAAELDAEAEDDVLAMTRALDLRELLEDELLLSLPVVPRHARCPTELPTRVADPGAEESAREHPFAALAALKAGKAGH